MQKDARDWRRNRKEFKCARKKKHKNNLVYSIKEINSRALGECSRDGQQCCNDGRCLQSKEMTRG